MAVPSSDLRRSLMEVNLANYELVMYLDKRLAADNGWLLTHAAALYGAARMAYFLLGSVSGCKQKAKKVLTAARTEIKDVADYLNNGNTDKDMERELNERLTSAEALIYEEVAHCLGFRLFYESPITSG